MFPKPSGHFHTGPIDILVMTVGVLVTIHVLRLAAVGLVKTGNPSLAGAGKVVAAFTLSD
jgi:hypothetical protein